jgi:NAD(P)-dependent dehydrogenase (short-subunit alcohol dehydrogenase family)
LAAELGRKGAITVSIHPGSVDTDMTRAYHKGMNPNQVLTPAAAAEHIVQLIEGLQEAQNGKFLQYDGKEIPW